MQQPPVYFHFSEINFPLRERNKIKEIIGRIFKSYGRKLERLDYIFCSDEFLLKMNKQWLDHDTYTDIITFDLSKTKNGVIGEVYISIDRVRENAKTFGSTIQEELKRVIFHGALHLCGLKDKSKAQQLAMRVQEDKWLRAFSRST